MTDYKCPVCTAKDCSCLCNTCLRARVIFSLPEYVYEMSDYSRSEWISKQVELLKLNRGDNHGNL